MKRWLHLISPKKGNLQRDNDPHAPYNKEATVCVYNEKGLKKNVWSSSQDSQVDTWSQCSSFATN